jgi:hypothetical protein
MGELVKPGPKPGSRVGLAARADLEHRTPITELKIKTHLVSESHRIRFPAL